MQGLSLMSLRLLRHPSSMRLPGALWITFVRTKTTQVPSTIAPSRPSLQKLPSKPRKSVTAASAAGGLPCCFCGKLFPNESILNLHLGRRHAHPVAEVLKKDPVETYKAIFGDQYKRLTTSELRYPDGLVVTLEGPERGHWFSFTKGVGGGPIKAIQTEHGFSFRQAMEFAAQLTGMSQEQLKQIEESDPDSGGLTSSTTQHERKVSEEKLKNVETSKTIWSITTDLKGSLAEKYLVRHRGIPQEVIDRLAFRYLPPGQQYHDVIRGEVSSFSCLIVPVENPMRELTGIQRIFLSLDTGNKCLYYHDGSKKSKGILKGSAGIVQRGVDRQGGTVFIVEGGETGASVASVAGPKVTVLAALSVSLLQHMGDSALAFNPKEVVLAVDNDVSPIAQESSMKAFEKLKKELSPKGISLRMVVPYLPVQEADEPRNIDWNDVLKELGSEELKKQLRIEN